MNYGGIYLDNDIYVINSLNKYRKYEITIEMDNDNIGLQVLIGHRNARLLKAIFDGYRLETGICLLNSLQIPLILFLKR
jgi:hypothetical protein